MKLGLFNSIIVVCAVVGGAVFAQGVKFESAVTLDSGKKDSGGSEVKKSEVTSQFSAAQTQLGELQKAIGAAVEKMKLTGGSAADREKAVDEFITGLKDAEASMNDASDLGKLIEQTIKNNQEKYDEYKKNTSDPNLLPEIRVNYEKLAKRFQDNVAGLYDKKLLLSKQVASLQDNIKLFTQNKKVFGDLVLADMTEEANKLVADVVDKAVSLNGELGKMAREFGKTNDPATKGDTKAAR